MENYEGMKYSKIRKAVMEIPVDEVFTAEWVFSKVKTSKWLTADNVRRYLTAKEGVIVEKAGMYKGVVVWKRIG